MGRDFLIVTGTCLAGRHTWVTDGGRACEIANREGTCSQADCPSQPVFVCAHCPEIDYGEPGGPGWEHCQACSRNAVGHSHTQAPGERGTEIATSSE